jgi:large subunit ribosomal protein L21
MTFAIIATGGKQYIVEKNNKIQIETVPGKAGDAVKFDNVLLTSDGAGLKIGKPLVGVAVEGKILKQGRGDKIHVLKYKAKSKYRRKIGHRQAYTEVEIVKI